MIEVIIVLVGATHPHDISFGHLVDLSELSIQLLLLRLLVVPCVDLCEPQVLDLVLAHEPMLHPALDVVDLKLLAALRHELMLVEARVVPDRVLLTFMEMIQGERTLVWAANCHTRLPVCHVCLLLWF